MDAIGLKLWVGETGKQGEVHGTVIHHQLREQTENIRETRPVPNRLETVHGWSHENLDLGATGAEGLEAGLELGDDGLSPVPG